MKLFDSFSISASGLTAERLRLDIIAGNLANSGATRTAGGGPYKRKSVIFSECLPEMREVGKNHAGRGVKVEAVVEDPRPARQVYDPAHPDAGVDGFVAYPNVNPLNEMVDMISATRAYEANATVLEAAKGMALRALDIGK
jgi:flagellar basal-body rod protein FlgC